MLLMWKRAASSIAGFCTWNQFRDRRSVFPVHGFNWAASRSCISSGTAVSRFTRTTGEIILRCGWTIWGPGRRIFKSWTSIIGSAGSGPMARARFSCAIPTATSWNCSRLRPRSRSSSKARRVCLVICLRTNWSVETAWCRSGKPSRVPFSKFAFSAYLICETLPFRG
jgi:hypothetical protein